MLLDLAFSLIQLVLVHLLSSRPGSGAGSTTSRRTKAVMVRTVIVAERAARFWRLLLLLLWDGEYDSAGRVVERNHC